MLCARQVRATQTLSYVSEGAIFLYVGMDTLDPLKWKARPVWCRHLPAMLRVRGEGSEQPGVLVRCPTNLICRAQNMPG